MPGLALGRAGPEPLSRQRARSPRRAGRAGRARGFGLPRRAEGGGALGGAGRLALGWARAREQPPGPRSTALLAGDRETRGEPPAPGGRAAGSRQRL